jgi:uncharacterized protein YcbK (DUF882 family)
MSTLYQTTVRQEQAISRRRFIKLGAFAALAVIFPCPCFAARGARQSKKRSLSFYNLHTEESLETVYWDSGRYLSEALAEINYILRDYRTGEIKPIDTHLLDLLCVMGIQLGAERPFHIISGYRSPETNAFLRRCGRGTARNSLHMDGKAIDVRLPGYSLTVIQRMAMKLRSGGVGYYPDSNFVHIDVGRVRYW